MLIFVRGGAGRRLWLTLLVGLLAGLQSLALAHTVAYHGHAATHHGQPCAMHDYTEHLTLATAAPAPLGLLMPAAPPAHPLTRSAATPSAPRIGLAQPRAPPRIA